MQPSQHMHYLFDRFVYTTTDICGVNFVRPDYRPTVSTARFLAIIVMGLAGQLYTVCCSDVKLVLQCSITMPVAWQGLAKMFVFITGGPTLHQIVQLLKSVAAQCNSGGPEAAILVRWALLSRKAIVFFVVILILATVSFCILPPYLYWLDGRREFVLPILMPGFDATNGGGYAAQLVYQMVLLVSVMLGVATAELSIGLFVLQVCSLSELLVHKLAMLRGALQANGRAADRGGRETQRFLHNILRMHIEYNWYMMTFSRLFYVAFFVEILFDALGMCAMMFVMQKITWLPVYMCWLVTFVKTFMFCCFGTITDIYAHRVRNSFESFPIQELAVEHRRKFVMIFLRAQKPPVLMCGTAPLNVALFVKVLQHTYSVMILMMRMSE